MKDGKAILLRAVSIILTAAMLFIFAACSKDEKAGESGIVRGSNDFLFRLTGESYDYKADYNGKLLFSDEELESIYGALNKRRLAYANRELQYMVAVIPNASSVYPEYLPASYGEAGETRLEQLTKYLGKKGGLNYVDLTDALTSAKDSGQLYNNTENSLNALGAYYVYEKIFNSINGELRKKNTLNASLTDYITESSTEGLTLAAEAGLKIENRSLTLSLPEDETMYSVMGSYENVVTTFVRIGFKNLIPTYPTLMLDCPDAETSDALMPYFSNTFGSVGYRVGYDFSQKVLNSVAPKCVIQLIREDELQILLDSEVNSTYNSGLKPGDDPTTTMTPILLEKVMTDPSTALLIGTVEAGSQITVSGSTFTTFIAEAQNERFFIPITLEANGSDTVSLTAKNGDKDVSGTLTVDVAYNSGSAALTVFAGKGSQLHYPDTLADYYCTNLFKQQTLESMENKLMKKLAKIRERSGKETKLVFLIPPDAITAYPETATDEMLAKKTDSYSRLMQIEEHFADNDDIIIINLTHIILENKDKGKLYFQTDTHWNSLGAYFGYYALMSKIAEEFPAAAPRELSQYKIYQQNESGGDLVNFLGVNQSVIDEYKTFCVPDFTNRAAITNYFNGSTSYSFSDELKCVVDDENLPNAIMICDSFGNHLFDFVSDAFHVLVRQTMWEYKTDLALCEDVQPDYYIQVMVERNMGNLYVN